MTKNKIINYLKNIIKKMNKYIEDKSKKNIKS